MVYISADLDFFIGLLYGFFPLIFLLAIKATKIRSRMTLLRLGRKAIVVKIIGSNKIMSSGIGKVIDNSNYILDGKVRPYDPKAVGIENRTPSIIQYERGESISLLPGENTSTITAHEYDAAITQAMISGANNMILKIIQRISLIQYFLAGGIGIALYLIYTLVEKVI